MHSIRQNRKGLKWNGQKDKCQGGLIMPLYDFKNIKTGEVETKMMTISAMEEYVKDPNIVQVLSAPTLVSGIGGTLSRAGDGWKEVQDKIKSGLPPRIRDNIKTK